MNILVLRLLTPTGAAWSMVQSFPMLFVHSEIEPCQGATGFFFIHDTNLTVDIIVVKYIIINICDQHRQ